MKKKLVIVFAKNIILGKVKTRLAKSVGDNAAFDVYKYLVEFTEKETLKLDCDVHVYFSDVVINALWPNEKRFQQQGNDLGERMSHAFEQSFKAGYEHIIGIGTDLPDLTSEIMQEGLEALNHSNAVFGPSEDGGYYLIGMDQMVPQIFKNKSWSTDKLMNETLTELENLNHSVKLLKTLNDVDTIEDLAKSSIAERFSELLEK